MAELVSRSLYSVYFVYTLKLAQTKLVLYELYSYLAPAWQNPGANLVPAWHEPGASLTQPI